MNQDRLVGRWKQLAGKMKEQWGALTDDAGWRRQGTSEYLSGVLQEHNGIAREAARRALRDFHKRLQ